MFIQYNDISDPLQFSINVILKEAKEESRLVKQIVYTMLSAYTNNPINLAINSPSGEGKTWVIQKVGEKFPEADVMFLASMTEKAIFHRHGLLVVRNEQGKYEPLDNKLADIDKQIEAKNQEIGISKDSILKDGLKSYIESLEKDKKDFKNGAKKLIDLSQKILVFLDSPRPELFNALMPLLSHDRYEVEYEFVDTNNGIKTRTNILRGWPAVIFAQAIDYSHYARYPEIQRRFIITNPKMTPEKYAAAVDLISDRYGLPDFVYQSKVVRDSEKEKTQDILRELKEKIVDACNLDPGKNNVIIPFSDILTKALPKEKAFDMTFANRFFGYLSLLSIINVGKRPRLYRKIDEYPFHETIPFALFEDLKETMFLMQYANGVRPYVLEWYYDVFLPAYHEKTEPDSKVVKKGGHEDIVEEKRIALTSENLVKKTEQVSHKTFTKKYVVDDFLNPLANQGYIDSLESELDHRSKIYYPLINTTKNRKLGGYVSEPNILQESRVVVTESEDYPDKQYIISKIQALLKYAEIDGISAKILDHEGKEISEEELAERYYKDPERFFESEGFGLPISQNLDITNESQENTANIHKPEGSDPQSSNKIGGQNHPPKFLFSCYHRDCDFHTNDEPNYRRHWGQNHTGIPVLYPTKTEIEKYGLQPQGKDWEI